jgi:hypothetical protein
MTAFRRRGHRGWALSPAERDDPRTARRRSRTSKEGDDRTGRRPRDGEAGTAPVARVLPSHRRGGRRAHACRSGPARRQPRQRSRRRAGADGDAPPLSTVPGQDHALPHPAAGPVPAPRRRGARAPHEGRGERGRSSRRAQRRRLPHLPGAAGQWWRRRGVPRRHQPRRGEGAATAHRRGPHRARCRVRRRGARHRDRRRRPGLRRQGPFPLQGARPHRRAEGDRELANRI